MQTISVDIVRLLQGHSKAAEEYTGTLQCVIEGFSIQHTIGQNNTRQTLYKQTGGINSCGPKLYI